MSEEIIDPNSIRASTPDWQEGYEQGKMYAGSKIVELMDEVIYEYRTLARRDKMDSESSRMSKAQLNAAKFIKSWVLSGGHEDEDGNRVCLPW